jgi:KDO2-lipid IV(A) lauroyltransferase
MVCTALEMGKAWLLPVQQTLDLVTEAEGLEELRAAAATGDGVILLAPHLGNWEVFGYYACEGLAANFMYQPPKSPPMDALLRSVRAKSGVKLAPTNRKGVAILLGALQRGELVGVLPDQVPADEGGVFAPFFGQSAFTMTLTSRLAQRLPQGKGFKAVVKRADSGVFDADLEVSASAINRSVESLVEQAPEQYQWEYKRFRRQADNSEFY